MKVRMLPTTNNYQYSTIDFTPIVGKVLNAKLENIEKVGNIEFIRVSIKESVLIRAGAIPLHCVLDVRYYFMTCFNDFEVIK